MDQLVPNACVSLLLPLRPRLKQCRWPLSPGGPAIVRREFVVLGRSHPGAGDCPLAPWGVVRGAHLGVRMVGHRSQHRSHRLLLVSPPRAQTALPSPPPGSVIAMQRHVDHWGSNKGKRALRAVTLESERLLLLVLLFLSRQ